MQMIVDAETVSDRLQIMAEYAHVIRGINDLINALAEETDQIELEDALIMVDMGIQDLLENRKPFDLLSKKGGYDPNNGTPQA